METIANGPGTNGRHGRLRRRLVATCLGLAVGLGGVASAGPASAHETHKYQYVYGNWNACQGDWNVVEWPQYIDHGWGHQGRTEAYIVRGSHCLRAKTETWSDHWSNGYRQRVSFTIRDASGAALYTTPQIVLGVEGSWFAMHARTDYYVMDLPQWVADRAMNRPGIPGDSYPWK